MDRWHDMIRLHQAGADRFGEKGRRRAASWTVALAALSGLLVGCPPPATTQPAQNVPTATGAQAEADVANTEPPVDLSGLPGKVHYVQPNDTLYSLAERYYGHGKYYRKILMANKNRITDPKQLPVGLKLIIPP